MFSDFDDEPLPQKFERRLNLNYFTPGGVVEEFQRDKSFRGIFRPIFFVLDQSQSQSPVIDIIVRFPINWDYLIFYVNGSRFVSTVVRSRYLTSMEGCD